MDYAESGRVASLGAELLLELENNTRYRIVENPEFLVKKYKDPNTLEIYVQIGQKGTNLELQYYGGIY
jgi:hypothetical protein